VTGLGRILGPLVHSFLGKFIRSSSSVIQKSATAARK
jgi:hypothetical protein